MKYKVNEFIQKHSGRVYAGLVPVLECYYKNDILNVPTEKVAGFEEKMKSELKHGMIERV